MIKEKETKRAKEERDMTGGRTGHEEKRQMGEERGDAGKTGGNRRRREGYRAAIDIPETSVPSLTWTRSS